MNSRILIPIGLYSVEEVTNNINLHVKNVKAIRTQNMISDVASSLTGVSRIIGVLIVVVWVLALAIMVIAYRMMINERKKEFAVLRIVGASKKKLAEVVWKEALMISTGGGIIGILTGLLVVLPFNRVIEAELNLPFLLPSPAVILLIAVVVFAVSVAAGVLASAYSASQISKIDAALILREGN